MSNDADKRFARYVEAVRTMYGQCAQCGGSLTNGHRCHEVGAEGRVDYKFNESLITPHVEMHYADHHSHQCVHKMTYDALLKEASSLVGINYNQSKRIKEFETCIHRVAEALGSCCGGVDGGQTQEGTTTRVLLEKIASLKADASRIVV